MHAHTFNRRAAIRIGAVSFLLAVLAGLAGWFAALESAEKTTVALAIEESQRLMRHFEAVHFETETGREHAASAAQAIVGGLFDIAEIYDAAGVKLAEASTDAGKTVEAQLPKHARPTYHKASYESRTLSDGRWVLRVFVPLASLEEPGEGFFEGVRIIPNWQQDQILLGALATAGLSALAALLCGAAIYPVVTHLSKENERKAYEVLDSHIAMMEALGRAIAKRDSDTGMHNYRVAWTASRIAERMGFQKAAMQSLIAGSFLHDVGKIAIPDSILLKPGRLDEKEMAIMRTHVTQGEEIVKGVGWLEGAREVVAAHHEKWDGSGYPRGLVGAQIPLAARIFAVVDVFDALCSRRPYKEPMSFDEACAILERENGSHFDPAVMAVFREIAPEIHATLAGCDEEAVRRLLADAVRQHFEV